MSKTLRENSKVAHTTGHPNNVNHINAGSLQRIADACEMMCRDRENLERAKAFHQHRAESYWDALQTERRRNAALRGVITRMKRKGGE